MSDPDERHAACVAALTESLKDIEGADEDLVEYIAGMLSESDDKSQIAEIVAPFLESLGAESRSEAVIQRLQSLFDSKQQKDENHTVTRKLQQGVVQLSLQDDNDQATNRSLWGLDDGVKPMANQLIDAHSDKTSAKDKRKQRKLVAQQERQRLASQYKQSPDAQSSQLVRMNVRTTTGNDKSRDIQVRNVSVSLHTGTVLLEAADVKLAYQRRYGLIGENGVGKSTFLRAVANSEIDGFPNHLRVLHVRQEVPSHLDTSQSVLQAVIQSDVERTTLIAREKELLQKLEQPEDQNLSLTEKRQQLAKDGNVEADLKELDAIYAKLQLLRADTAEARAAMILSGLQFSPERQMGPISDLSGGWRMRVALAAALFIEPDLLMLDEPTNHLDLEAVLWLENYLVDYPHTILVVSHDRGFLNEVCTDIIEFKRKSFTYYRGNFDTYVKLRDEKIRNAMRVYNAYKEKRDHMMDFITKFRANAKRATMVQSRIKAVEKMDAEAPEPVEIDSVWRFALPNSEPLGPPIIAVNDVSFDYSPVDAAGNQKSHDDFLLQDVNFGVDLTSRIAILGANGQGKTTLLNLIMGRLTPLRGNVSINSGLRVGHFTQHSSDNFDLSLSAVENLLNTFEEAEDQEIRSFLGKFQIQGDDALKPMMLLSGGQKSRVAFAALAYKKPHVLVIDEGSNHLSMEAVDALVEAIQDFKGGIMVVSHDEYFVSRTCRELWVVHEGKATRFRGDFDEYKKHTSELTLKRVEESVKKVAAVNK